MNRRRNIYPMDASDPNLRWCKDCDYPYMPAGGCKVHEDRCLTCCGSDCSSAVDPVRLKHHAPSMVCVVRDPCYRLMYESGVMRRRVKADIEALYGPPGGDNG